MARGSPGYRDVTFLTAPEEIGTIRHLVVPGRYGPQSPAEEQAMRTPQDLPACPVGVTVHVIGSKWKLLILQQLSAGAMRFNELQAALDGISNKVLSTTLRSLDEDGIIVRKVHPASPISVEYRLSKIGLSLRPVLDAMGAWGEAYRKWRQGSRRDTEDGA